MAAVALLVFAACDKKLSEERIIPSEGSEGTPQAISGYKQPPWETPFCHPKGLALKGPSDLTLGGECPFRLVGGFRCRSVGDDFYVFYKQELADGGFMNFYINVEHYKGSGDYPKKAEIDVHVHHNTGFYRWFTLEGSVNVDSKPLPTETGRRQSVAGTVTITAPLELQVDPGTFTKGTIPIKGTVSCVPGSFSTP
jgi:hypothetical protein